MIPAKLIITDTAHIIITIVKKYIEFWYFINNSNKALKLNTLSIKEIITIVAGITSAIETNDDELKYLSIPLFTSKTALLLYS